MNSDIRLSEILIYPIKSLAGISLLNSQVNPEGLKQDRLMIMTFSLPKENSHSLHC